MIGYIEEQDFVDYALARGVAIALLDAPVPLTKALDWLELQEFSGEKTDPEQALSFPRDGATTIPDAIKNAQMACGMVYFSGGDPLAPIGQRVTGKSVDGAVSITYSDRGNQSTLYPLLTKIIRPFLAQGFGGTQFVVTR